MNPFNGMVRECENHSHTTEHLPKPFGLVLGKSTCPSALVTLYHHQPCWQTTLNQPLPLEQYIGDMYRDI